MYKYINRAVQIKLLIIVTKDWQSMKQKLRTVATAFAREMLENTRAMDWNRKTEVAGWKTEKTVCKTWG